MGILTSGSIRDRVGEKHMTSRGVIENKLISYTLRIPRTPEVCDLMGLEYNDKQFFKYMKYGNYLLTRVKDVKPTHYDGIVYDLQMKHEHNYTIHNGLVHNGGGKRNGSIAIYIEPWHKDIEDFLLLRKNHGAEEDRARDLFYALWIPDLFMKRVKENGKWYWYSDHTSKTNKPSYRYELRKLSKEEYARVWHAMAVEHVKPGGAGGLQQVFGWKELTYSDPKYDLWNGGTAKSNVTFQALWQDAWGNNWQPEHST